MAKAAVNQVTLEQQDAAARAFILTRGRFCRNLVQNGTVSAPATSGNQVTVNLLGIGLVTSLWLKITGTVTNTNGASTAINLTQWGPANLITNFQFLDQQSQTRHNSNGRHLSVVQSLKRQMAYGNPATYAATGIDYSENYTNGFYAPTTIAAGATATVSAWFEIPISYTPTDLTGAVWCGVTNANASLKFTINPAAVIASGDPINALYTGTTGTLTNVTWSLYQDYYDGIAGDNRQPILPIKSMGTNYCLLSTVQSGLVANQWQYVPYANLRSHLSTVIGYDNAGTFNAGTDITTLSISAANVNNLITVPPDLVAFNNRLQIGTDLPAGWYAFDHRRQPISTDAFGNMALGILPSSVGSGAFAEVDYEYFALAAVLSAGQSVATSAGISG